MIEFVVFLCKVNDAFERSKEKELQQEVLLQKQGYDFYTYIRVVKNLLHVVRQITTNTQTVAPSRLPDQC